MVTLFDRLSTSFTVTVSKMRIRPEISSMRRFLAAFIMLAVSHIISSPFVCPAAEQSFDETVFSIEFQDKPLKRALTEISWITGYSFLMNREYAEYRITANLQDVTIHQGLKELIGDLNHTIIYEPDKTISLIIYAQSPPEVVSNPLLVEAPLSSRVGSQDELPEESESPEKATDSQTMQSSLESSAPGKQATEKEETSVAEEEDVGILEGEPDRPQGQNQPDATQEAPVP
jgi:hypothetical protein